MAKKKEVEQAEAVETADAENIGIEQVSYAALMTAKVRVVKDGVTAFYLDPARALGEFVLRPIPQPAEEPGEVPEAWRRPTQEEAAAENPKVDWGTPDEVTEAPADDQPEYDKRRRSWAMRAGRATLPRSMTGAWRSGR